MYDMISIGSATVDVFARTDFSELVKILSPAGETDLLAYPSGSKILINELNFTIGGGGTNTAVAFSRLGLKAAFLGKLGNDENARFVCNLLKKEKVDTLCVKGNELTGFSVVLDSIEHDRTILVFKGANNDLKWNEVKKNKLKTRWFYFGTMMKESFKTLEKLSEFADKNNIKIGLNASEYLAKKGLGHLGKILKNTEILVLNDKEAALLSCKSKIKDIFRELHKSGPRIVAVTFGKKGVIACDNEYVYKITPRNIKVVETTGAGDAFAAGFITGFIKGKDMEFALRLGQSNAESVILHHGAKEKLLNWKEGLNLAKRKHKVEKNAL